MKESKNLEQNLDNSNEKLHISDVSVSLLEEINNAADKWVFETNGMKWSNNDDSAGDNFGSFVAGAKWILSKLNNEH